MTFVIVLYTVHEEIPDIKGFERMNEIGKRLPINIKKEIEVNQKKKRRIN